MRNYIVEARLSTVVEADNEEAAIDIMQNKIANDIENLRTEIYSSLHININDPDDKTELDDLLFSIQSKLRYEVREMINCYEEE